MSQCEDILAICDDIINKYSSDNQLILTSTSSESTLCDSSKGGTSISLLSPDENLSESFQKVNNQKYRFSSDEEDALLDLESKTSSTIAYPSYDIDLLTMKYAQEKSADDISETPGIKRRKREYISSSDEADENITTQTQKSTNDNSKPVARKDKKSPIPKQKPVAKLMPKKELTAFVDLDIVSTQYGVEILSGLQSGNFKYEVKKLEVPYTIFWTYVSCNEASTAFNEEMEDVLIIIHWKELVWNVAKKTLLAHIKSFQRKLPNKRLHLCVYQMEEYYKTVKRQSSHNMRAQVMQSPNKSKDTMYVPILKKCVLEDDLTELQLLGSCSYRFANSAKDVGGMVLQMTKAISTASAKMEKLANQSLEWYVTGDNKGCVKVDNHGNGLRRLWQQQLSSFPLCSLEPSEAIITKYGSPIQLMNAYDHCISKEEGENLLRDLLVRRARGPLASARKVGPELSKKFYTFFTSLDGETVI